MYILSRWEKSEKNPSTIGPSAGIEPAPLRCSFYWLKCEWFLPVHLPRWEKCHKIIIDPSWFCPTLFSQESFNVEYYQSIFPTDPAQPSVIIVVRGQAQVSITIMSGLEEKKLCLKVRMQTWLLMENQGMHVLIILVLDWRWYICIITVWYSIFQWLRLQ